MSSSIDKWLNIMQSSRGLPPYLAEDLKGLAAARAARVLSKLAPFVFMPFLRESSLTGLPHNLVDHGSTRIGSERLSVLPEPEHEDDDAADWGKTPSPSPSKGPPPQEEMQEQQQKLQTRSQEVQLIITMMKCFYKCDPGENQTSPYSTASNASMKTIKNQVTYKPTNAEIEDIIAEYTFGRLGRSYATSAEVRSVTTFSHHTQLIHVSTIHTIVANDIFACTRTT